MIIINKKNVLLMVLLSVNCFFCVYGMEQRYADRQAQATVLYNTLKQQIAETANTNLQFSYKEVNKEVNLDFAKLKDMAPEVKIQILEAERKKVAALQSYKRDLYYEEECLVLKQYHKDVASIALNPNNLMSKKNRLTYLKGDTYFNDRKSIIKSMIDDGIDLNEIDWMPCISYKSPLYDTLAFKNTDIDFARYLLAHGARPHCEELHIDGVGYMYKHVCKSDALKNLFLQYKIMFYRINNFGHIIPEWQGIQEKDLAECLLNLINAFVKAKKDEVLFSINVIYNGKKIAYHNIINIIKEVGFKTSYADEEEIQLLYEIKNTPSIQLSQGSNKTRELIGMS